MKNFALDTNYGLSLPQQKFEPKNTTQLQEQLERDRLISSISQRIHQATSLNETLNTAVLEVRELLNCERALIYRFGWNQCGTVVQEAVVGDYPSLLGQSYSAEVLPQEYHQIYSQGRVGVIHNINQDQLSPCMVDFMQEFQTQAKLVVPIRQQEELWGLLVVHHCSTPRNWHSLEVNLVKELAIHIAIAIKQASLKDEAQTELQQRKLAEEKIQQLSSNVETSLSLLCATLDVTNDGILVVNNHGKILSFNHIFVEMWNIPESVLEPRDYSQQVEFVKNQLKDPASFEQMVSKMYYQPEVETYNLLELNDGRYFERYTKPQLLAKKFVGTAISFRDITEQKSAIKFKPQPFDLRLFCKQLLSEVVVAFGSNHSFEFTCLYQYLFVKLDINLMGQIINNLLTNAVKYSPQATTIKFAVFSEKEQIILSICDEGIGIPASEQAELFEEFHRGSNVDNISGNELGLSIVKQAVELHGGTISVESEVGIGTNFTVCIPKIQPQTATS